MGETYLFVTPLWEIGARGTMVYFTIALVFRLIPKRQAGTIAPNDMMPWSSSAAWPPTP